MPVSTRSPHGGRRSHGFTLTELVMVIVMIGILAVVVVPSFNSKPFLARGYFDEVMSAARHGQKLAVASGCPVQLVISGSGYDLQQPSGCTGVNWITVTHPARAGGYTRNAPSGVTLSPATIISFSPDGSSSGSSGSIAVGDHAFSVELTGYVSGG